MARQVLFLAVLALLFLKALPEGLDGEIQRMQWQYGVSLEFQNNPESYFPAAWLKKPITAKATVLDRGQAPRMLNVIERFFRLYPRKLLKEELKRIFLFSSLEFYGKPFGGTNAEASLFLTCGPAAEGYTEEYLLKSCIHEFSEILLAGHPEAFDSVSWQATLPEGFRYSGTGVEMLGDNDLRTSSEEWLDSGFPEKYAMSSIENDLSVCSEYYFFSPLRMEQWAAQYPRIKKKLEILDRFYGKFGVGPRPKSQ